LNLAQNTLPVLSRHLASVLVRAGGMAHRARELRELKGEFHSEVAREKIRAAQLSSV
jgi:hypothetical protein